MSHTDKTDPASVQAKDRTLIRVRTKHYGPDDPRNIEDGLEPLYYGGCNGDPLARHERRADNRKVRSSARRAVRAGDIELIDELAGQHSAHRAHA